MLITAINLIELKNRLLKNKMSTNDINIINRIIWDAESKKPDNCDIIMVLGNPTCAKQRLPKAISLYYEYNNPYIVLTGGVKIPYQSITEAESMHKECLSTGIPENRIILEQNSTITKENVLFSAPLINRLNIHNPTLIVVSDITHLRRVSMNFERFNDLFPETSIALISSSESRIDRSNWVENEAIKKNIATELGFIHEYLYVLNYPSFNI